MAVKVEIPASALNTTVELPLSVRLGEVETHVGTITLDVVGGQVEDVRPVLADAFRQMADALERAPDDEEVPDAAAHG